MATLLYEPEMLIRESHYLQNYNIVFFLFQYNNSSNITLYNNSIITLVTTIDNLINFKYQNYVRP